MKKTQTQNTKHTFFVSKQALICFGIFVFCGMLSITLFAQKRIDNESGPAAIASVTTKDEDVKTLDGIIKAYYEVVSGPAGSIPDKARDLFIHIPDAQVIMLTDDGKGNAKSNVMTITEFHERSSRPRKTGFYEYEIKRETMQYGAMTHIWSTYEWKATKDGPLGGRGINSIQLFHDGNRWWIAAEIFDTRNKPIPPIYMPK